MEEGNIYHERQWMHEGHILVGARMAEYLPLLHSDDRKVVLAAVQLVSGVIPNRRVLLENCRATSGRGRPRPYTGNCNNRAWLGVRELGEQIIPALEERLNSLEGDPFITAGTLDCLAAVLSADSPLWIRYVFPAVSGDEPAHPLVRFVAALSLAWHHRAGVTPAAVDILVDAMVAPQRLDELYEVLPDTTGSVYIETCSALVSLGAPIALEGLIIALRRGASTWPVVDTARVAEALLDVAFFGKQVQGRY